MMAVKLTQSIKKAVGEEASADLENLLNETLVTKYEFAQGIASLEQKIAQTREDFLREISSTREGIKDEIKKSHVSIIKWVVGAFIVSGGLYHFLG